MVLVWIWKGGCFVYDHVLLLILYFGSFLGWLMYLQIDLTILEVKYSINWNLMCSLARKIHGMKRMKNNPRRCKIH
jgi:hypothetical protein